MTNLLYTTFSWVPLVKPVLSVLAHQFLNQDRAIIRLPDHDRPSQQAEMFIKDTDILVRWSTSSSASLLALGQRSVRL